jgi:hypothetical protein
MKQFFQNITDMDIRSIIALLSVLGVLGLLYLLVFHPIPVQNNELLYMSVGQVLALGFGTVSGYYFGSSKNEADKKNKDEKPL